MSKAQSLFLLALFPCLLLSASGAFAGDPILPPVTRYQDKETAGWAYKSDDQAFVVEVDDCQVKWNVSTPKEPGKLTIDARSKCEKNPDMVFTLSDHVLTAIMRKYSADKFGTLFAPGWCDNPQVAERVAVGAMDMLAKNPKLKKIEFKEAFIASDAVREWRDMFLSFGLNLDLSTPEKISESPFNKLPFAGKYPKYKNKKTKVPTASLMCWFKLSKVD